MEKEQSIVIGPAEFPGPLPMFCVLHNPQRDKVFFCYISALYNDVEPPVFCSFPHNTVYKAQTNTFHRQLTVLDFNTSKIIQKYVTYL
jgi:hypothetical protein